MSFRHSSPPLRLLLAVMFFLCFSIATSKEKNPKDLRDFFGMNGITYFHLRKNPKVWEIGRKKLEACKKLGVTHQRIDFWWGVIEPEMGKFSWDFPDRVVKEYCRGKQKVMPIFCYFSAWSGGNAPADDAERARFGRYVRNLVSRYKGKIKSWEVWNEPNVTPFWEPDPDPVLYTRLLKVAYSEAKIADEDCIIAAPCTSLADFRFIEDVYENGGGDYFDVLSYHHYGDKLVEGDLRRELIDLSRLMSRYGDDEKGIWITEIGLPTGSNDAGKTPVSLDTQAEWMVKKHIIAIASRKVKRIFWFTLADDPPGPDVAGHWGVLFSDLKFKPAGRAYQTMTSLLKPERYVGPLAVDPDIFAYLFEGGHKRIGVFWRRSGARSLRLPQSRDVTVIDLYGKRRKVKSRKGRITLALSQKPIYVKGLGKEADIMASFNFAPEVIYPAPGDTKEISLWIENPYWWKRVSANVRVLPPPGFKVSPETFSVSLKGKMHIGKTLTLATSPEVKPGLYRLEARADFKSPFKQTLHSVATIRVIKPLAVSIFGRQTKKTFKVKTSIKNLTNDALSGIMKWELRPRGKVNISPVSFTNLRPNDSITTSCNLIEGNLEVRLVVGVKVDGSVYEERGVGLMPMPLRIVAPKVDGSLDEWMDVPGLRLNKKTQLIKDESRLAWSARDASGILQFWWTKDALYVAANITDDMPQVNPNHQSDIWRGDCVELYLGLGGPTQKSRYGVYDFQLGLSPGHKGRMPEMWNWKTNKSIKDGRIVSRGMPDGYIIEAKIPLDTFAGWQLKHHTMIGFDVALDDLDSMGRKSAERVLMWNGTQDNWRDPSNWGVAIIH